MYVLPVLVLRVMMYNETNGDALVKSEFPFIHKGFAENKQIASIAGLEIYENMILMLYDKKWHFCITVRSIHVKVT